MLLGIDNGDNMEEAVIHIGYSWKGQWDFIQDDGTPFDFSTKTGTAVARNIAKEFKADPLISNFGTVTFEPEGVQGRIELSLTSTDTNNLKVPASELDPYTDSDSYAKIVVLDESSTPILDITAKVLKV